MQTVMLLFLDSIFLYQHNHLKKDNFSLEDNRRIRKVSINRNIIHEYLHIFTKEQRVLRIQAGQILWVVLFLLDIEFPLLIDLLIYRAFPLLQIEVFQLFSQYHNIQSLILLFSLLFRNL